MTLNEMAYDQGCKEASEKFAAGQMFSPSMPPMPPRLPSAPTLGGNAAKPGAPSMATAGAGTAPMGMTSAATPSTSPAMGLQSSPVMATGQAPSPNSAAVAGQTALQGAAHSVTTQGSGK